ncbi:hypothetical protein M0657_007242 [Pyricularia oryzae]|nr:hypothetical protein M0657_007242 [Pyricularia oryzae]
MKKFLGRKDKSPKPPTDNPYAQEPANDPYAAYPNAAPKSQVRAPGGLPAGPGGGLPSGPRGGLPSGPARGNSMNSVNSMSSTSTAPPPYQSQQQQPPQQSSGYGNERYGASGGYGSSNRYGNDNSGGGGGGYDSSAGRRGPGGYGGLGRTDTMDDQAGKEALFGGGKERVQNAPRGPNGNAGGYGASAGGYGAGNQGSTGNKYGGYGEDRELTEEERIKLEERDLARQIDQERDATVDTGHRILGIINSTIETANGTMQNMAQQDERLRNTERNLDLARIHNRTAEERTKELKHYNRSLWNPGNPFMSKSKQEQRERKHLENTQKDRELREATRADAYESQAQYERDLKDIETNMANRRALGLSSSEKAASNNKFVFDESDEEDDNPENMALRADRRAKEDEINNSIMPQMEAGVATLNRIARNFAPRIEESNQLIGRLQTKSDVVSDGVERNKQQLDRIYKKG